MNVWVLHIPEERVQGAPALLHLPLDGMPDVTSAASQTDMRRILREQKPESPPESISREAERLWACTHGVAREDILAIPLPAADEVAFAEAAGPVTYESAGARYVLPVKWFERRARLSRLKRYRILFEKGGMPIAEVQDQQVRVALRALLPLKANRFARWRWLAGALIALQMFYFLLHLVQRG